MNDSKRERLIGHPSDYGGRTLEEEELERNERELDRTADGDPLTDRGTADSAISQPNSVTDPEEQ